MNTKELLNKFHFHYYTLEVNFNDLLADLIYHYDGIDEHIIAVFGLLSEHNNSLYTNIKGIKEIKKTFDK